MVATTDQWITERTGIRQRHIVEKGMATSDMAVEAVKQLLERRGMAATEVECIIVATVTPDMMFPGDGLLNTGQDRGEGRVGVRSFGGVFGVSVCAAMRSAVRRQRRAEEGGGGGRGHDVFDHRLPGPRDLRDLRRRRRRSVAGAGRKKASRDAFSISCTKWTARADALSICRRGGANCRHRRRRSMKKQHYRASGWPGGIQVRRAQNGGRERAHAGTQWLLRRRSASVSSRIRRTCASSTRRRSGWGSISERVIVNIGEYREHDRGNDSPGDADGDREGKLKRGDLTLLASVGAGYTVGATLLRWAF